VPGKTKNGTYGIWLNYMEELSTAHDLLPERGETEISSNIVFAVVCDVMRLCAHDLERILAASRSCAQATRALVPS